ncbi:MAG: acyl-CoA dehydrogenase family protein [Acidobacteria bacterium]|nr:acyl-CoA dehydrogenase family protein [Acidobacteriota bacterium]
MSVPTKELKPMEVVEQGRAALADWERGQPENFYESDRHLQNILEFYWGATRLRAHSERLSRFGHEAATIIDQAARSANIAENLPRLERYSAIGERTEDVMHCTDHHFAGKYIYGSGAMSVYARPDNNLLALALFYLSSYNGEAGHNCPLACTAGVIKTLQHAGNEELKTKYLPRLLDSDYATRFHGAQFLTEVQGGSDVGSNAVTATLLDERQNKWLINGEKWFCSNVTADLALITARPERAPAGTKGLGLFLVPRHLDDGTLNGIFIRRLKDKLGTKSLATAEVEFCDAVAYQIGEPGRGFQHAMDYVINTSRLYNAVGSTAAARRAYVISWTYAQRRQAFGTEIINFPLVQETLAEMRCVVMALTSGSLYLAHLRDEIETKKTAAMNAQFFRLAVNLNKYCTSTSGTETIRRGIEVLGGNGAMENFSVMPRLLRDSVIFETWEGAHNTLLAQSVRDIQRNEMHETFCTRLNEMFASVEDERGMATVEALRSELAALPGLDELSASVLLKPLAGKMMWLFYLACLSREAAWEEKNNRQIGKRAVIEWLWQKHFGGSDRKDLSNYLQQLWEIIAAL